MFTKFHDNTIETKFIQNLVSNTNIPCVPIWKPGTFVIKDCTYLTQFGIYKANTTGKYDSLMSTFSFTNEENENEEKNVFEWVSDFVFGKEYPGYTTRYVSETNYYNAETHRYLGEYLRAYRDIYNIDLMPFYNCFGGEYTGNIDFDINGNIINKSPVGYKIASIPVRFNTYYSISIDCDSPIYMMCAIEGNKGNISSWTDILNGIQGATTITEDSSHTQIMSSFKNPFIYKTPDWSSPSDVPDYAQSIDDIGQYERFLRLLIKIPKSNNSTIVVLEGLPQLTPDDGVKDSPVVEYPKLTVNSEFVDGSPAVNITYWYDEQGAEYKAKSTADSMLSNLSLIQESNDQQYAFSNRLLEFLLLNVIDSQESIRNNIERIQEYITNPKIVQYNGANRRIKNAPQISTYSDTYTKDVWADSMRKFLFNLGLYTNTLLQKFDLTGFVDKDIEQIVTRGQQ